MDAGIPLATIQRWLGHANISQTSTYLGASLGGDEHDMQVYEARIGRPSKATVEVENPVTHSDVLDGSNGHQPSPTDVAAFENTQENDIVH